VLRELFDVQGRLASKRFVLAREENLLECEDLDVVDECLL